MSIGEVNLHRALSHHTRLVEEDEWSVAAAAAAGSTSVTVTGRLDSVVPVVGPGIAPDYQGAKIIFTSGANNGFRTRVTGVASSGGATTVSFADGLPGAAAPADTLVIMRTVSVTVTAPENLAQWAGTALAAPLDDDSDSVAPVSAGVPRLLARLTAWTGSAWTRLRLAATGSLTTRDDATGATGAAAPAGTVQIGGVTGSGLLQALNTDGNSRLQVAVYTALPAGANTIGAVTEASLDPTTGATAAAAPSRAIQVGGTDGTDLRALLVSTTGRLRTAQTVQGPASTTSPGAGVAFASAGIVPYSGTALFVFVLATASPLDLIVDGTTWGSIENGATIAAGQVQAVKVPVCTGHEYALAAATAQSGTVYSQVTVSPQ